MLQTMWEACVVIVTTQEVCIKVGQFGGSGEIRPGQERLPKRLVKTYIKTYDFAESEELSAKIERHATVVQVLSALGTASVKPASLKSCRPPARWPSVIVAMTISFCLAASLSNEECSTVKNWRLRGQVCQLARVIQQSRIIGIKAAMRAGGRSGSLPCRLHQTTSRKVLDFLASH